MTAVLCRGLASLGWSVHEHAVPGSLAATRRGVVRRPRRRRRADPRRRRRAARRAGRLDGPRGARAAGAPACAWSCSCTCRSVDRPPETDRRHPDAGARGPLGRRRRRHDQRVDPAPAARAVPRCPPTGCTSPQPGVDAAELATGTAAGGALLCVAAVTFDKGHDVLLEALATVSSLSWHCVCVGSLDRDPAFVEHLARRMRGQRA